tara:strand:+ start:30 stop:359 length:330 start_codon:yes stop_codon:yes gene_type:complete
MKIIEYNNVSFVVGQSAKENWDLFDKYLKINNNFIWFHLNSFSSGYVFMLYEDIENIELINYGAFLCKENTKYKNLKDIKICYTTLNKLKKTNIIGEIEIIGKTKTIKL